MTNAPVRGLDNMESYNMHRSICHGVSGSSWRYIQIYAFDSLDGTGLSVQRNRFPYRGYEGVQWVVWVHPRYRRFWGLQRVRDYFGAHVLAWENDMGNRSIPEITHYHIVTTPLGRPRASG